MPLKAPIAFFDNSISYGSSVDEELIELTANYENEDDDDTDDNMVKNLYLQYLIFICFLCSVSSILE